MKDGRVEGQYAGRAAARGAAVRVADRSAAVHGGLLHVLGRQERHAMCAERHHQCVHRRSGVGDEEQEIVTIVIIVAIGNEIKRVILQSKPFKKEGKGEKITFF